MTRYRSLLTILLLMVISVRGLSINTETRIFDPLFRTLKVQVEDNFMTPPIISLGSSSNILISFDEITTDVSYLRYRLIHCNADWQPSALLESEYVSGFNIASIEDYAFSSNTFTHFINYQIRIPNADMEPLVSGNYLLQVFPEDDEDKIILQARFSVCDDLTQIAGNASNVTDRGSNGEWQQLNFTVNTQQTNIQNPFTDLIVTTEQNSMPTSLRVLPPPMRSIVGGVVYEHQPSLIYPAGNEFRRFETVRADYPGLGVDSVRYVANDNKYHAYLKMDNLRGAESYVYDQTQFGRFMIRDYYATDADLGADYIMVHFRLRSPEFMEADMYVEGEMTEALDPQYSKMKYNRELGCYELTLPLKQGSYNYRYAAAPRNDASMRTTAQTEGNNYETRNEYLVKVYHRAPGSRADALIGYTLIYSF